MNLNRKTAGLFMTLVAVTALSMANAEEFQLKAFHPKLTLQLPDGFKMTKESASTPQYSFRSDDSTGSGFMTAMVFPAASFSFEDSSYTMVIPVPTDDKSPALKVGRKNVLWRYSKIKSGGKFRYLYEATLPFADLKIRALTGEVYYLYLAASSENEAEAKKLWEMYSGMTLPGIL